VKHCHNCGATWVAGDEIDAAGRLAELEAVLREHGMVLVTETERAADWREDSAQRRACQAVHAVLRGKTAIHTERKLRDLVHMLIRLLRSFVDPSVGQPDPRKMNDLMSELGIGVDVPAPPERRNPK